MKLRGLLEQRYDTILTPATPGAAPIKKKRSGVFSRQSNPTIGTPEHRCGSLVELLPASDFAEARANKSSTGARRSSALPHATITLLVVTHLVENDPAHWRPVQRGRILDHHAVAGQVVPDAQYHQRAGVGARDSQAVAL